MTTYYMDANIGNDSYNGLSSTVDGGDVGPWLTVDHAMPRGDGGVTSGDTVMLKDGNYGSFADTPSPPNTDWITYQAFPGHSPIFTYISCGLGTAVNHYYKFDGITVTPGNFYDDPGEARAVFLNAAQYIKLHNITIIGTGFLRGVDNYGIQMGNFAQHIEIDNCYIYGTGSQWNTTTSFGVGITSRTSNYVTINNCEIRDCEKGILSWGEYWTVSNNEIHHGFEDGIYNVGTSDSTYDNNYIHDIAVPIFLSYSDGASYDSGTKTITADDPSTTSFLEDMHSNRYVRITTSDGIVSDWEDVASFTGSTITATVGLGDSANDVILVEAMFGEHTDGIQLSAWGGVNPGHSQYVRHENEVYTRNKIHDIGRQCFYFGIIGNFCLNMIFENNVLYRAGREQGEVGNDSEGAFKGQGIIGLTMNNNTIVGKCTLIRNITHTEFCNNIISQLVFTEDTAQLNNETNTSFGPATDCNNIVDILVNQTGETIQWDESSVEGGGVSYYSDDSATVFFKSLFSDFDNQDFYLSAGSEAIEAGNTDYAPSIDILGVDRGVIPCIGAYEYVEPITVVDDTTLDEVVDVLEDLVLVSPRLQLEGVVSDSSGGDGSGFSNDMQTKVLADGVRVYRNKNHFVCQGAVTVAFRTEYPTKRYIDYPTGDKRFLGDPSFGFDSDRAEIRYTINGKNPTGTSKLYRGPFIIKENISGSRVVLKFEVRYRGKVCDSGTIRFNIKKSNNLEFYA